LHDVRFSEKERARLAYVRMGYYCRRGALFGVSLVLFSAGFSGGISYPFSTSGASDNSGGGSPLDAPSPLDSTTPTVGYGGTGDAEGTDTLAAFESQLLSDLEQGLPTTTTQDETGSHFDPNTGTWVEDTIPITNTKASLEWGGKTFTSKSDFNAWLKSRGQSFKTWATLHPAAAVDYNLLPPGSPASTIGSGIVKGGVKKVVRKTTAKAKVATKKLVLPASTGTPKKAATSKAVVTPKVASTATIQQILGITTSKDSIPVAPFTPVDKGVKNTPVPIPVIAEPAKKVVASTPLKKSSPAATPSKVNQVAKLVK
jgi:hypothetical protein